MKLRNAFTSILTAIFLALYLSGCSRETIEMPSSSGGKEADAVSTESGEGHSSMDKKVTVKIIPENPSSGDELQGVTTGGQSVK